MARRRLTTFLIVIAVIGLAAPADAGLNLFKTKEPEQIFEAATTHLEPGVHVVRSEAELREIMTAFEGDGLDQPIDFEQATLLVIVGRDRDNDCRRTEIEVGTRFKTARVGIQEIMPGPECECRAQEPVRWVFGVLVAPFVKKAKLEESTVSLDCGAAPAEAPAGAGPVEPEVILSGTLVEGEAGASLLTTQVEWSAFCARMNQAASCPRVDFSTARVAVIVGQPLQNACRSTEQDGVIIEEGVARFALREIHPSPDRMCAQVYGGHQVFAFRLPASVTQVELDSRKVQ
jgi:hypothetical protein